MPYPLTAPQPFSRFSAHFSPINGLVAREEDVTFSDAPIYDVTTVASLYILCLPHRIFNEINNNSESFYVYVIYGFCFAMSLVADYGSSDDNSIDTSSAEEDENEERTVRSIAYFCIVRRSECGHSPRPLPVKQAGRFAESIAHPQLA